MLFPVRLKLAFWWAAVPSLLLLSSSDNRGNLILEWNKALLTAIRDETTPPPLAARNLAIIHLVMHDAVQTGCQQQSGVLFAQAIAAKSLPIEELVIASAYSSSTALFPNQRALFVALKEKSLKRLNRTLNPDAEFWAEQVSNYILVDRASDGSSTTTHYIPQTEVGAWRRTPPLFRPPEAPYWGKVRPFLLESPGQFRPKPPPSLSSPVWAHEFKAVKDLGGKSSSARSAEQTETAYFWSDFSYTVTPPGHWNEIAADSLKSKNHSLADVAKLFAALNVALADAAIACWDSKYHYNFWRPVTAIRSAYKDGNAKTIGDSEWMPLLSTPPFPEYVSGHSAFSGAAATILTAFHGTDSVEFSVRSDSVPGVSRTFKSFTSIADEIGMSRVYGGIHYSFSAKAGSEMGKQVGNLVARAFKVGSRVAIINSHGQ